MVESKQGVPTTGLEVHDILRILFKHKWKILVSAVAGFAAAAGFYFSRASLFETEAKVLVRYIVDRSAIDPVDSPTASISVRASNDSLMNSEVEILTSVDLAMQVAETIGVERVLPGSKGVVSKADAAQRISSGLKVTSLRASNIIWVSYTNNDPQLAALILDKLIAEYFIKHLEVHRDAGTINFVTIQSDGIKNRLAQTDAELKRLMGKAGILSLRESASALTAELAKSQEELHIVEAELAEQTARVRDMEKSLGRTGVNSVDVSQSSSGGVLPSDRAVRQYEALIVRLAQLRQTELDFLSKYTPGNPLVTLKQTEIENLDRQRRD